MKLDMLGFDMVTATITETHYVNSVWALSTF